jgi:hypothetical protein
MGCVIKGSY